MIMWYVESKGEVTTENEQRNQRLDFEYVGVLKEYSQWIFFMSPSTNEIHATNSAADSGRV